LRACCTTQAVDGWRVPPATDLQEEEDVQPLQPGRLDGKEIGGEHLLGVLAEELPPGHPAPLWCRSQTSPLED
jgi:hypothetical protein